MKSKLQKVITNTIKRLLKGMLPCPALLQHHVNFINIKYKMLGIDSITLIMCIILNSAIVSLGTPSKLNRRLTAQNRRFRQLLLF